MNAEVRQIQALNNDEQYKRAVENRESYADAQSKLLGKVMALEIDSPAYVDAKQNLDELLAKKKINDDYWKRYSLREWIYRRVPVAVSFLTLGALLIPNRFTRYVESPEMALAIFCVVGCFSINSWLEQKKVKHDMGIRYFNFPKKIRMAWYATAVASMVFTYFSQDVAKVLSRPFLQGMAHSRQGSVIEQKDASEREKNALAAAKEIFPLIQSAATGNPSSEVFYERISPETRMLFGNRIEPHTALDLNPEIKRIQVKYNVRIAGGSVEGMEKTCPGLMIYPTATREEVTSKIRDAVAKGLSVTAANAQALKSNGIGHAAVSLSDCGTLKAEHFQDKEQPSPVDVSKIRIEIVRD